jgi:hypothetical protein
VQTWCRVFTYTLIYRSSDCARKPDRVIIPAMSLLLSPIELSDSEKLEILRRLDRFRKWQSLEEKRYCLACGHILNGHGIQVVGGTRGTGPLRLICPTERCHSIPMDWVVPSDRVLAKMSMLEEEESSPRPKTIVHSREKFTARLRKFAMQFRRAA